MSDHTPAWVGITYLLYCAMIIIVFFGGTGYAVFCLGHSGWWFILPICLSVGGYSPWRWHCICTGIEVPYRREFKTN